MRQTRDSSLRLKLGNQSSVKEIERLTSRCTYVTLHEHVRAAHDWTVATVLPALFLLELSPSPASWASFSTTLTHEDPQSLSGS